MYRHLLSAALCLWACVTEVHAQQVRFDETLPGGVVATGNTLGLSQAQNDNGPGTQGAIGTFLTLSAGQDLVPTPVGAAWPTGTTSDWTENGSAATLDLPPGAVVVHAELVWSGSYLYGGEDVSASLDMPVTLRTGAASTSVSHAPESAFTLAATAGTGFAVRYYVRSADVTEFVRGGGPGSYSVHGVPATQGHLQNTLDAAGWALVVAYRDATAPVRHITLVVDGTFIEDTTSHDVAFAGFCTPATGNTTGTLVVGALEGDANSTGDRLLVGPSGAGPFVSLSGPNNNPDNFFASQLNGTDGALDTRGTYGGVNHSGATGTNVSGGRQGWDVTTLTVGPSGVAFGSAQMGAVVRALTTGDAFVTSFVGLAVDVHAPDLRDPATDLTVSPEQVSTGQTLTVSATLRNTGHTAATGLQLRLEVDGALQLTGVTSDGNSGDILGAPVSTPTLATGIAEGDLAPGETRRVVLTFDVTGAPGTTLSPVNATWTYEFTSCAGGDTAGTLEQGTVWTYATVDAGVSDGGAPDGGVAEIGVSDGGAGDTGSRDDAGPRPDAGVDAGPPDRTPGGGCHVAGRRAHAEAPVWWMLAFALAIVLRAERRRSNG